MWEGQAKTCGQGKFSRLRRRNLAEGNRSVAVFLITTLPRIGVLAPVSIKLLLQIRLCVFRFS